MEFSVKSGNPEKQRSACVVVGVFDRRKLSSAARVLDKASGGALSTILRRGDMDGEKGQTLWLYNLPNTLCERVLLVGCGKERDFDEPAYRGIIATMARTVNKSGAVEAVNYLTDLPVKGRDTLWKISQAVTIIQDSLYSFQQLKSKKEDTQRPLKRIVLSVPSRSDLLPGEEAVRVATAISVGTKLTRDLANLPGNICNPTYLAEQACSSRRPTRASRWRSWKRRTWKSSAWAPCSRSPRAASSPPS